MLPRYPAKILKACKRTPFLLGPVNGGVPFPEGFQEKARQESAQFNFLRALGRFLIPGYVETYKKADRILAGSTFTFNMLKELFSISDSRISLLYENGISKNFLEKTKQRGETSEIVKLLFVGRLVPYKCADILIDSLSRLDAITKDHISLKIVGDGSQRNYLEKRVKELNLDAIVNFVGWISQQETLNYYSQADIFCFPSVREFGGAVVLEAMACGLPCIVVNNGGIGEYVTEETGFKIEPVSKEYVTQELTRKIKILVKDESLRTKMSENSFKRVQEFTWERKATQIMEVYREIIAHK
jgi:glycosyltransferase involved in cell wall biosynthesis